MAISNIPTVKAKSIVYKNQSPSEWFGTDYSMNIYRGCNHGCIYCDSRSDCFKVDNFDTVKPKENALQIIRDDLRRKAKVGVIGTGAMSDPYNHLEKDLKLTRNALELINAFGFGISLCTKSPLVARDIDVLRDIQSHSPVNVMFSITMADDNLCKKIEPYVPPTSQRFEAIRALSEQGIFCGVLMMPILPFISDNKENIVKVLHMAKDAGANFVYASMGMTLRHGSREYYYDKLDTVLPDMAGIREKYQKRYGNKYNCSSPNYKKLWATFNEECEKLELLYDMRAIVQGYKGGYGNKQITLDDMV